MKFVHWSPLHLLILAITFTISGILAYFARIRAESKKVEIIGFIFGSILILNYFIYVSYRIYSGYWEVRYDLPMEVCNWSAFVTSMALFTKRKIYAELSYFWVMTGSIHGILTPDLDVTFPHIYFFIFFIGHSGLVIFSIYAVFGLKLYPEKGSVLKAYLITQAYIIIAFLINYLVNGNYGYMMAKPKAGSFLDYLGEWPFYILNLDAIILILFIIAYFPFYILNKRNTIDDVTVKTF